MSLKQEREVIKCNSMAEALKAVEAFDAVNKAKYQDYVRAYNDPQLLPDQKVQVTIGFNYRVDDKA